MDLVAFKTYAQCPLEQRPASIPLEWPWVSVNIPDTAQADFKNNGFTVLSRDNFFNYKAERQFAYHSWANSYDISKEGQVLRVIQFVDEKYKNFHPSKIDFRLHLQQGIYLQKNVTYLPNGRPQLATYYYNKVLIAEIEFEFQINAFNFMTRRIERLAYYKANDTKSEQWVITDNIYNDANPYHLREMMKERSESRALIIEEIKAFLNGVLAAHYIPLGYTYGQLLEMVGTFWNTYSNLIDAWISVGSPQFQAALFIDNTLEFLSIEVTEGVTVKQYVIDKTSY